MTDLLDPQTLRVFRFVRDYNREHGIPPSHREIASATFLATATMVIHLTRLEMKGWLYREYNIPRSTRVGELAPSDEDFETLWKEALDTEDEF